LTGCCGWKKRHDQKTEGASETGLKFRTFGAIIKHRSLLILVFNCSYLTMGYNKEALYPMQEHIGKLRTLFESYKRDEFTGGIKIAFLEGIPHTLWISSVPDFKSPALESGFNLNEKLSMAANAGFSGSLFCSLDKGEITHFYFNQTLQGRSLENFLNKFKFAAKIKPIIAVRTKR
jgi:hypothetical protein